MEGRVTVINIVLTRLPEQPRALPWAGDVRLLSLLPVLFPTGGLAPVGTVSTSESKEHSEL